MVHRDEDCGGDTPRGRRLVRPMERHVLPPSRPRGARQAPLTRTSSPCLGDWIDLVPIIHTHMHETCAAQELAHARAQALEVPCSHVAVSPVSAAWVSEGSICAHSTAASHSGRRAAAAWAALSERSGMRHALQRTDQQRAAGVRGRPQHARPSSFVASSASQYDAPPAALRAV